MIFRLLYHVHTRASHDSMTRPVQILEFCAKHGIHVLAVTDHDSNASLDELTGLAPKHGVVVVPGVEHLTSAGDVISLFSRKTWDTRSPADVIDNIHADGGLVVLPHPYYGHELASIPMDRVDIVEGYNARQSTTANARSRTLAAEWGKPSLAAADAHWSWELGQAVNVLSADGTALDSSTIRSALLTSRRRFTHAPAHPVSIELSQLLSTVKKGKLGRLPRRLAKLAVVGTRDALKSLAAKRGRALRRKQKRPT